MNKDLANNIKIYREKHNLSQNKLGQILSVTQQAVGKWEKAIAEPDCATLIKLSDLFNISIDILIGKAKESTLTDNLDTSPNDCTEDLLEKYKDSLNNKYFAEITKLFPKLNAEEQALTLGYINGILEKQNNDKTNY